MSTRRSLLTDDLLLIAATTIMVLTLQRYLPANPPRELSEPEPGGSARSRHELSQPKDQRSSGSVAMRRAGWKDILWRTYGRTDKDRLLATAGGVVFFGLLSVFPAITALVSCYGLFANPSTIGANLQRLALMLPEGAFQIIQDQVSRVLSKGNIQLGTTFLFGLGLAIWSANAGVKAVIDALNVAYEERERRGFLKLNLISLVFTVCGIAAVLLMVGAVVAFPLALDHVGLAPQSQFVIAMARWPLLFVILVTGLGILYRFGPSRRSPRWEWLSVGTLFAALLWLVGSSLLSWYLSNFAHYDATYGSLGAAIGLMMWMWVSAITVLFGAELNSEMEQKAAQDRTIEAAEPLGISDAT